MLSRYNRPALLMIGLLLLGAAATSLRAQTYLQNAGVPTFTTALPVENGFVNLANGNLHLVIPFGRYQQRGNVQGDFLFTYDSNIWTSGSGSWQPQNISTSDGFYNSESGWRLVSQIYGGFVFNNSVFNYCSQDGHLQSIQYNGYVWFAPDGTQHSFPVQTIKGYTTACGTVTSQPSGDAFAADATGYHLFVSSFVSIVYAPDGSIASDDEDTNGNWATTNDTVGRILPNSTGHVTPPQTFGNYVFQMPNSGTYTAILSSIRVSTNFGSGITEYSGSIPVVSELDLPDGTKYTFGYDSGTTPGTTAC